MMMIIQVQINNCTVNDMFKSHFYKECMGCELIMEIQHGNTTTICCSI